MEEVFEHGPPTVLSARLDGFLPKSTLNTAEERLAMQQHAEAQGY